ncbi:YtzI protein [Peribacillus sp. SCS-155]|uniref:YtzI protein n=1 Tax=Peribacillus sedimenti TaxID=3115297 RepID=UPI0039057D67
MKAIIIIGVIIVLVVLLLSVLTINKGYSYKHTIDPIDPLPDDNKQEDDHKGNL